MSEPAAAIVHATAVAFGARAVLLRGPSGSGKSDLALRCLALSPDRHSPTAGGEAIRLVADDQVRLTRLGASIVAEAPPALAGLLEIRGVGIVRLPVAGPTPVALVVDLVEPGAVERFPPLEETDVLGVRLARLRLHALEASTPEKILFFLMFPRLNDHSPACNTRK